MKRNTVIFECSGIGPKMLYSRIFQNFDFLSFSKFFKLLQLAQVGVEFHLLLRYCPIFPLKLDFEKIPELLEEVDEDQNWWKISIMAGYLDR